MISIIWSEYCSACSRQELRTKRQDICSRWSKYRQMNWYTFALPFVCKATCVYFRVMYVHVFNYWCVPFDSLFKWDCIFIYQELKNLNEGICPRLSKHQQSNWHLIHIYLVNQTSKGASLRHDLNFLGFWNKCLDLSLLENSRLRP